MTWIHWRIPPFITSVFFVLGMLTFYWTTVNWIKHWAHQHQWTIKDSTIESYYGLIYMISFTFGLQSLIIGHSYNWQFMNFQLIAIIFCGYFLEIKISNLFLFPVVIAFMAYNGSLLSWESWGHAITLLVLFSTLSHIHHQYCEKRLVPLIYLAVIAPLGGLLWFWMKLKHDLSWQMMGFQWLYLMVFAILLYIYVMMLTQESEFKQTMIYNTTHDALTKTANFAAYQDSISGHFQTSRQTNTPLAMVMFDIDHFKAINDRYGHLAGDAALKQVVDTVQTVINANDHDIQLFRTGGEEFNLIFPAYNLDTVQPVVWQIFLAVNHLKIRVDHAVIEPTISVGVSELRPSDQQPPDLYTRVDQNLYHSKQNGRRQITSA